MTDTIALVGTKAMLVSAPRPHRSVAVAVAVAVAVLIIVSAVGAVLTGQHTEQLLEMARPT